MTHPNQDVRYTDSMVRANPRLHNAAVEWALGYTGDFEPMIRARLQAEATGTLTVLMARTVLNTARMDPEWAAAAAWYFPEEPRPVPVRPVRALRVVEPPRPAILYPKVTWKRKYASSTWPTATVTHILNADRSHLRYYTYNGATSVWLYGKCNAHLNEKFLLMHDEPLPDRRICRRCLEQDCEVSHVNVPGNCEVAPKPEA